MVKNRDKIKILRVPKSWKCHLKVCVLRDRWMWFCVKKASVLEYLCMLLFQLPVHPPLHLPDSSSCSEPLVTQPSSPSQCLLQGANSEGPVPQTNQGTEKRVHGDPVVMQRPEHRFLFPCLHAEHPSFPACPQEHPATSNKSLRKLTSSSGCLLHLGSRHAGQHGIET